MELKIKVQREKYEAIASGEMSEFSVELTQSLKKKISGVDVAEFDKLCVLCMFSSDSVVFGIKSMVVDENTISFVVENNIEKNVEQTDKTSETVENVEKEVEVPQKTEKSMKERVDEVLTQFYTNNKVVVVGGPRVAIHPNGVVFGTGKKLPILNDVRFYIDIEKQTFYFTYDMTEDEFINQLKGFLKKMLLNNYAFVWKKKCEYKEEDGKRFLTLYYTTRRYVNQSKKLL